MKVFMMTDMEGVAGIVSFEGQAYTDDEKWKKLATAEYNAAVEGLYDAGVEDVVVWDAHGPGAVVFEDLHPKAKVIHGRPCAPRNVLGNVIKEYDAAVVIGQHAMAGVQDGNLNHTQSSRSVDHYKLNDRLIGEIAQFALYVGAYGLPLIFLSGDEAACEEVKELIPAITTAAVKKGLSRNSAICLSKEKSRALIREKIKEAVEAHEKNPIQPLVWDGPFVLEKRFFHTDTADAATKHPGAERVNGQTIRIRSDNILDIIYE